MYTLQIVMGCILIVSGLLVLLLPTRILAKRLSWVGYYSYPMRVFICICKILGGMALFLPSHFHIGLVFTPIAAALLAVFMFLAARYHIRFKEYKDVPATLVFMALSALIFFYNI